MTQASLPMSSAAKVGNPRNGTFLRAAGPISQLQEYVQSDWLHPVPSHRPILHWSFDTRMGHSMILEFRAMVSFTLEGILHHAAGSWQTSKKSAQRDAAQRVLWLAMDQWSKYSNDGGSAKTYNEIKMNCEGNPERTLEMFAAMLPKPGTVGAKGKNQKTMDWRMVSEDGKNFQAVADFDIFGVRHTFPGSFCRSKAEAKDDCARRILWYLKCPGYENEFEVDCDSVIFSEPPPLPNESLWQRDGNNVEVDVASDAQRLIAEQKTLLMRVQNRLQKAYVHQLPTGASVWDWSYEFSSDAKDKLCRAWVKIHIADKEFKGDWCRGQKKAQFDACERVQEFLDTLEAKGQGMEIEDM
eukprot:gnl/MRDRNA2_/MRDRNA2_136164_c0_seq1.p1 gnl/MRDRNA2_/MRDRNA2_136164_c0~~gnl/MRDRNA2_/MRDRNA2_136164_c0_seq1.p1  ORF type:complete len:412 (-),score=84.03 gnl/MRDRNA2_/MRDRNA2_136164_c0_seq1:374-1438(-)